MSQRQFGNNWIVTVNYLGSRTNNILSDREITPGP